MPDLTIVMVVGTRWIHIVSACVVIGGMFALLGCLPKRQDPDAKPDENQDDPLPRAARLFEPWFYGSVLMLAVSGAYLWASFGRFYGDIGVLAQSMIGSKVLLAVLLIIMAWADTVGLWSWGSPRGRLAWRLSVALLVVLIAGVLRHYRLELMLGAMS